MYDAYRTTTIMLEFEGPTLPEAFTKAAHFLKNEHPRVWGTTTVQLEHPTDHVWAVRLFVQAADPASS